VVEVRSVEVAATEVVLRSFAGGVAEVHLVCSSGFYVRSLAHDLGVRLGCGAHLEALRRTRSGEFTLTDAVTLDVIATAPRDAITRNLVPMERLLSQLPALVLTVPGAKRISHGADVGPADLAAHLRSDDADSPNSQRATRFRLLDGAGALIALAEPRADGSLHPVLVLV